MNRFDMALEKDPPPAIRTWHYVQSPGEYGIQCDKCQGSNIEGSEYAEKIWCYDCKIDTRGTEGIFDGPIPMEAAAILGMCFDRWDMVKKVRLRYDKEKKDYVPVTPLRMSSPPRTSDERKKFKVDIIPDEELPKYDSDMHR